MKTKREDFLLFFGGFLLISLLFATGTFLSNDLKKVTEENTPEDIVAFKDSETGEDVSNYIDHVEFYRQGTPITLMASATSMEDIVGMIEEIKGDTSVSIFFLMNRPYYNMCFMTGQTVFLFHKVTSSYQTQFT